MQTHASTHPFSPPFLDGMGINIYTPAIALMKLESVSTKTNPTMVLNADCAHVKSKTVVHF